MSIDEYGSLAPSCSVRPAADISRSAAGSSIAALSCAVGRSREPRAWSRGVVDAIGAARWINRRTLILGGFLIGAFFAFAIVYSTVHRTAAGLSDGYGHDLGDDVILFWSGGRLAAQGKAALAYEPAAFQAVGEAVVGPFGTYRIYVYPPIAMLLSLPLGVLGYVPALIVWLVSGAGLMVALLRRLVGWRVAALALIAVPASALNLLTGQNGYFTAGLLAGGLMILDEAPVLSGICFGCLAYKPQMALLVPIALAAGGRWRTFAAAAATAVGLVALSLALFGTAAWVAFFEHTSLQRHILEWYEPFWHRMPTVFAFSRLIGVPVPLAYGAQAISAAAAAVVVAVIWRSAGAAEVKFAGLLVATFLAAPHAWDYDEAVLVFAAVWLASEGARTGFLSFERLCVLGLLLLPLLRTAVGAMTGLPFGAIVLWLVLAALIRRVAAAPVRPVPPPPRAVVAGEKIP